MTGLFVDIGLIFLFIVLGGIFAAAEMSLVSLREAQLRQISTRGKRGAKVAELAADPNRFLSAVQIGVTLSGFLSAAFGGVTLANRLSPVFIGWGIPDSLADGLALVVITLVISYFSITLGELAAKRLAMQRAEVFAMALAPLVNLIATLARPAIWLLGVSTDLAVRLLGGDPNASREEVSREELRSMVSTSSTVGDEERQIVDEVFNAGQRSLREVMVPRTEVDFLPGDMQAHRAISAVQGAPHSRYPVYGRSVDEVLGFLHVRDLMDLDPTAKGQPVSRLARPVTSLPGTMRVLRALAEMRRTNSHLAIVRDEYGGCAGIVTIEDLVEELVGDIKDEYDVESETYVTSAGAADIDGLLTLEEFAERTGYVLPEGPYDTVAGFWVAQHGELPETGESIDVELLPEEGPEESIPLTLTVTEMDGRRAARIMMRRTDDPGDTPPVDAGDEPAAPPAE